MGDTIVIVVCLFTLFLSCFISIDKKQKELEDSPQCIVCKKHTIIVKDSLIITQDSTYLHCNNCAYPIKLY